MNRTEAMEVIRRDPESAWADELAVRFAYGAAERARLEAEAFAEELGCTPGEVLVSEDEENLGAIVGTAPGEPPVFFAYLSDQHADARLIVVDASEVGA
jgi:hypothetical protein